MTDKRVKVTEERIKRISQEIGWPIPYTETACEAIYGDLVDHPIVPTDEQIEELRKVPLAGSLFDVYRRDITEFQRRFLFAPAEPEDKFNGPHLLTAQDGTQARCAGNPKQCAWCAREDEAFKRGQQSMIRKDG